jgi:type II secretory pathway predicted ATPase ExeA
MNRKLLQPFSLKWNPFSSDLPVEALEVPPAIESFCWRIEQHHVREGGFALITGDPGTGKSVALRILFERLSRIGDVSVAAVTHPQSNLADFYREMGDLFGVPLRPHNRWMGFKALRQRFETHIEGSLMRPVLLIDECQEMSPQVLSELRILSSTSFDSRAILSVVLAGDSRITEKLRKEELLPLGSRLRVRLDMGHASPKELLRCLEHVLRSAGNATLMTEPLRKTLCEHAAGNRRILMSMAAELLALASERDQAQLDEKLYFELFESRRQGSATAKRQR